MPFNPLSWFGGSSVSPSPPPSTPASPTPTLTSTSTSTPITPSTPTLTEPARLRRQLTLLLSGGAFLLLSITVTRRSLIKRRIALIPPFYHPNTRPPLIPPNSALDAFSALNLASLNTLAFAMLLVGGGMFSLDVCNVQELRERVRGNTEWGVAQREAEEEFEEWVAGVLARKEIKEEVKRRVERELGGK